MSYISEKGFAGKVMNEALAVDYGRFNNESKGKGIIIQGINNPSQVKHNDLLLCDLVKMIDEASKELRKAKRNRTDVRNKEIKIAKTKLDSLRKELGERNNDIR